MLDANSSPIVIDNYHLLADREQSSKPDLFFFINIPQFLEVLLTHNAMTILYKPYWYEKLK